MSKTDAQKSELSPAEIAVLDLIAAGLSNQAIAQKRGTSFHTVKNQVTRIFAKTGWTNRTKAAVMWRRATE